MMGMITLLTRFPAVKVTSEDAMSPKSSPSEVKKSFIYYSLQKSSNLLLSHCALI